MPPAQYGVDETAMSSSAHVNSVGARRQSEVCASLDFSRQGKWF